jgi:hypothetical protein
VAEATPAGGDILIYARVCDVEERARLRQLLDDLPGERIDDRVYEVFTADWDEGLWDEVVQQMLDIVNSATDTLIFWRIVDGKLLRTSLAGRS